MDLGFEKKELSSLSFIKVNKKILFDSLQTKQNKGKYILGSIEMQDGEISKLTAI